MTKQAKRPGGANQSPKLMVDILTGEIEDREAHPKSEASILSRAPSAR